MRIRLLQTIFLMFLMGSSLKADDGSIASLSYAKDTFWVLVAAFLVFFMQAGFGMVEAGLTRAKNAVNEAHNE